MFTYFLWLRTIFLSFSLSDTGVLISFEIVTEVSLKGKTTNIFVKSCIYVNVFINSIRMTNIISPLFTLNSLSHTCFYFWYQRNASSLTIHKNFSRYLIFVVVEKWEPSFGNCHLIFGWSMSSYIHCAGIRSYQSKH